MPKLSPTMEEGNIAKWHKAVGDKVESGDLLLEVATDKATVEYNAIDAGWLRKIIIGDNGSALVNQAIAIFTEDKNESIEGYIPTGITPEAAPKPEQKEAAAQTANSASATPAAQPSKGAALQQPAFVPEKPLENYNFLLPTDEAGKRVKASPLAKKLAKERGLDLGSIKGSGPGNRIVEADLPRAQATGTAFSNREAPTIAPGTYEEETMTPIRKVIGQRLQESKSFIPHFYVQQTIDAQPLLSVREQLTNSGIKVTFNDFVIRACALNLRKFPNINSGFNSVNQTIIRFKTIDIAVAVSINGGLITPIVRHADFKNIGELSVEVKDLAKRAKDGKLDPQEYKGGSFTISNLGMYGVTDFQAIINPPQAAILAVSGIQDAAVVKNGVVVPGKTMNIQLSVDHRVIDGVAAAEFIKSLQKLLENPAALLV